MPAVARRSALKAHTGQSKLLRLLGGGDRRSIGRSNLVVEHLLADRAKFDKFIGGLVHDDPLVRMRCADALEKVSALHPEWLQKHKLALLALMTQTREQEVRWHLAQMLPRLRLTAAERRRAVAVMVRYLDDASRIVKTFALQALADFAERDAALRERVVCLLRIHRRTGSPAMRARARKLLTQLATPS